MLLSNIIYRPPAHATTFRTNSKKRSMFGKSSRSPGKGRAAAGGQMTEGARLALAALQEGDCKSARDGLEQALGVSTAGAPRRL